MQDSVMQGMTKTVRILLFVNIWTTFLDTNIMEKVMDEVETEDLNPLGYTFHSESLVIPVKERNLVHISQSYTINETSKVTKVHWKYDHDKLLEFEHAGLVPLSLTQVYSQPFHQINRTELVRNPTSTYKILQS